jgi:hypothetical protein
VRQDSPIAFIVSLAAGTIILNIRLERWTGEQRDQPLK